MKPLIVESSDKYPEDSSPNGYHQGANGPWRRVAKALFYYCLTTFVTFLGGRLGVTFVADHHTRGAVFDGGAGPYFANWDGQWYKNIVEHGYYLHADEPSSVNFFPSYPVISRGVMRIAGLGPDDSLLLVSNLSLLSVFILMTFYVSDRSGVHERDFTGYVLLALGLSPPSFFFRMAYSESLFLLTIALFLYGVKRHSHPAVLAVIVGLATATRSVGIALIPAFAFYVWEGSPCLRAFFVRLIGLLPVALWGLFAYIIYLFFTFGEPLAFVHSQEDFSRHPGASAAERFWSMLTLQPFLCRFDSSSPGFWSSWEAHDEPFFSLYLVDPFFLLAAAWVVLIGVRRRWLTSCESLVSAGLLFVPWATRSFENDMASFGRYAAIALPVYLVLGRILCRLSPPISAGLLAVSAVLMAAYTALFAKWYVVF